MYSGLQKALPRSLRDYVLHFEAQIERAVEAQIERAVDAFAGSLVDGVRVLDAGAGESRFAACFSKQRYVSYDLAVGDTQWNYEGLDAIGDLQAMPFRCEAFDAVINIVTLEHVREPAAVIAEIGRCLKPGGRILLVVPHEWEEHQQPHDYYRYTRYGVEYLMGKGGFTDIRIDPVGGYFRLMSRRLLNGLQFFPGLLFILGAVLLAPAALIAPLLDPLDKKRNFTLGYICTARKA